MINAIDVIDRLPYELQAALECDPFFADIPVVVAEKGNIKLEMEKKAAVITKKGGKRGVAVIILQMVADDTYPELSFGAMRLNPAFQIIESVELNNDESGTGKSARKVARRIRDVIKPLRLVGLTTDFVAEQNCIEAITIADDMAKKLVAYQVNFYTFENDSERISQVSMPQYSLVNGQLQLTSGTDGADIYYTTDDTFPGSPDIIAGSTAKLFSGPIDVPAGGFTVRAAAFLEGYIASQVNRAAVFPDHIENQQ